MGATRAPKLFFVVATALSLSLLLTAANQQSVRAVFDNATTWMHPHVSGAAAAFNNVDWGSLGLALSVIMGGLKAFLLAAWLKVAVTAQAVWSTVEGFEGWTDAGAAVFALPSLPWITVSVIGLLALHAWWLAQTRRQVKQLRSENAELKKALASARPVKPDAQEPAPVPEPVAVPGAGFGPLMSAILACAGSQTAAEIAANLSAGLVNAVTAMPVFKNWPAHGDLGKTAKSQEDAVKRDAVVLLLMILRRLAVTPGLHDRLWRHLREHVQVSGYNWVTLFIRVYASFSKDKLCQIVADALGLVGSQEESAQQVRNLPGKCGQKNAQTAALAMLGLLMKAEVVRAVTVDQPVLIQI